MPALCICSLQQATVLQGAQGKLALGCMHLAADRIYWLLYRVQWWLVDDGEGGELQSLLSVSDLCCIK
jgi:hypothetical protein